MLRTKTLLVAAVVGVGAFAAVFVPATAQAKVVPGDPNDVRPVCAIREFSYNMKNPCVKHIKVLINSSSSAKLQVSEKYDWNTYVAVKNWQSKHTNPFDGKKLKADGITGPKTWGALCSIKTPSGVVGLPAVMAKLDAGCEAALNLHKPSTPSQKSCIKRTFSVRQNSYDKCVGYIQTILNGINKAGLGVDKHFGSNTHKAVVNWQGKTSLKQDGIVGPNTWSSLCAAAQTGSNSIAIAARDAGCSMQPVDRR